MPTNEDIRAEVRAWLAAHWHDDLPARTQSFGRDPRSDWLAKVVAARWAVPRWSQEWLGRGLDDAQARIIEEEFSAVGAPGSGQDRTNLWANTALKFARESFKAEIVPELLSGSVGMCLLYSEPGAGSDLAATRTRADAQGDTFVVTGQKVWTSGAHLADYGMLLARTDWDVPKHKGLSFFFLPMKQKGVEIRPINQITGESHFNEVFLDAAVVPAANLLGPLNGGWAVLQTALAYERSLMGDMARGTRTASQPPVRDEDLLELARDVGKLGDPAYRQRIAQVTAYRILNRLNTRRGKAELAQGTSSPIMSLGKLAMSRILHEEARLRTDLLEVESLLEGEAHPRADRANFLALDAYFTSIGGGTDQIQRNIIGERLLGLPKEPEVDRDVAFRKVRAG
ncbi:acyl-CoA dehydrogenase family protein [Xanthobacter autotrophicus]|uniref:acyl-CoA dehydrogenase family protein n=1 Tax=Xanthobacter autotrophicus TaxID=280 RepID=UPI003728C522